MRLICRCCGGNYEKAPHSNPNICSSCEQLLEDDFPASTPQLLEVTDEIKEKANDAGAEPLPVLEPRSEPLRKN